MLSKQPSHCTNVAAFQSVLDLLESVLIYPKDLASHWGYTEEHLCTLRRKGLGIPFIRLATGGIRYRASDIIGSELKGTEGPITLDRVLLAVAACPNLSLGQRADMQNYLRAAFPSGG